MKIPADRPVRRYSEEELQEFEAKMGIVLPAPYREYIMKVGAGFWSESKVTLLEEWCQPDSPEDRPSDFLKRPFPHTDAWDDHSIDNPDMGWASPYYDEDLTCGSMRIVNTGCEGYHLLVVTGPEAGNMWHDGRVDNFDGIWPLCSSKGIRLTFDAYLKLKNDPTRRCSRRSGLSRSVQSTARAIPPRG